MVTMHLHIAKSSLFFEEHFFSFRGSKETIWHQWKTVLGCTAVQSRNGGIGYPISVLIWEMAYLRGITTRIALLCTSRFFQDFDFWIQHTFLHKNTPSNLLASTTWLNLLLALWLIGETTEEGKFFKASLYMYMYARYLVFWELWYAFFLLKIKYLSLSRGTVPEWVS